jgi:aldose 1-epimerase
MKTLLLFFALAFVGSALHAQEAGALEVRTLRNAKGTMEVKTLQWGATLISVRVPDAEGKMGEVTLGFDEPARYLEPHPFFGSIAGRYANRIAKGRFTLDGKEYVLAPNNGPNHLHGGKRGFDKRVWWAEVISPASVRYWYTSADDEEGYPGALQVSVTYTVTAANELRLDYEATTDEPTVLNLTNHAYWNLAGEGDVLGEELSVNASRYTPVDAGLIPTGAILPVAGTPLDFTSPKRVGAEIAAFKGEGQPDGYDHNFVLEGKAGELRLAAEMFDPKSGRVMRVQTTEPGVQLYTGNGLRGVTGRGGVKYAQHAGLCLETQHFPDSPNHPEFPSVVLRPGETFRSTTIYAFSTAPNRRP